MAASLRRVNDATPTPPIETPAPDAPREALPKGEQTKALILETAMRLFQERGYDKTTMRAIASEAGVSVRNAYYYYEGKEFRATSSSDFASSGAGSVGERGRRDF
jgi:AcrR family transcriptional regulator